MSLPPATRDHLTLSYYNPNWDQWEDTRTLEAGEFDRIARSEGYVKLDGIDVEALRASLAAHQRVFDFGGTDYLSPASPIWRAAKAVLAALEEGGTDA